MANAEFINGLISHPERMNSSTLYELRTTVARYPYFQKARLLLLCNLYLLHDPDFNTELHRSIFYIADRRELWRFVNGLTPSAVADELPATSATSSTPVMLQEDVSTPLSVETPDRTMSLIDDFLQTLGMDSVPESEMVSIEPSIAPSDTAAETPEMVEKTTDSEGSESELQPEFLTETLARIFIKQKKYDRALAIIRSLYLNFPEKSIYFADQIRFLEKLVRNNQSKKV